MCSETWMTLTFLGAKDIREVDVHAACWKKLFVLLEG